MSRYGSRGIGRRRFLGMLGATAGVAAMAGTVGAATSPAGGGTGKIVRMAGIFPLTGSAATAAVEFPKWIAERTKGELTVQVFPAGQLGAEREMIESVQLGAVEISIFGLYPVMNIASEWGGVMGVPYLFRDQDHYRKVLDGPLGKPMSEALLARKGIRHIAWMNRGPRYLTSNKPVNSPADLRDVKMRVPEIEVYMAAWKMLGATVVPMALTEIFLALKQGTINGQESNYEFIYNNSLFEAQKYVNLTRHTRDAYDVTVSERWWKTVSPDQQKILTEGLVEMAKLQDKLQAQDEAEYEKKLKDKGMTFNTVDASKFQDGLKDLPKQFAAKWKPGFYDDVLTLK
jgi:tripartite ATP-independent transporter DctP family solute receptor